MERHAVIDYLRVESVQFKRLKRSKWETGILVNEGCGVMVDADGKVVKSPLWDWRHTGEYVMTIPVEKP